MSKASLTRARSLHTTTTLLDGSLVVAGGYAISTGEPVATAELFAPR